MMRWSNGKRSSACGRKRRYPTAHAARRALREVGQKLGDLGLESYRCRHCRQFHIGHAKGERLRALKFQRLLSLITKAIRS
jgi:hypothetical protein